MKKQAITCGNKLSPGDVFNPHRAFHGVWIPQWLEERSEVSEKAKKLYAYLTYFARGKGKTWPSCNTLAEKLHVSRRYVINLLHELSNYRLIKITRISDQLKGNRSNIYEFLWHEWMQHEEEQTFSLKAPDERPPIPPPPPSSKPSISGLERLPTLVNYSSLAPGELEITTLVKHSPPKENKEKRTNYKHLTELRACNSVPTQTASPPPAYHSETFNGEEGRESGNHGVLWQEWLWYNNTGSLSSTIQREQAAGGSPSSSPDNGNIARAKELPPLVNCGSLAPGELEITTLVNHSSPKENKEKRINYKHPTESGAYKSVPIQADSSLQPARHSAGLVRKAWQVARSLLHEFWDNCKVQPNLGILAGYAKRALQDSYEEKSIRDAFERSLHQCHGHATDCGEIWEPSSTVHRAEKWLKENGSMWQPTPPEERLRIRAEISAAMEAWKGAQQ
jgi:hypothetical protein